MNKIIKISALTVLLAFSSGVASTYDFDYDRISQQATAYTVIVDIEVEVSFGTQTTEMKNRSIGSIVSADGLVMFDGAPIDSDDPYSIMSGMQFSIEPKKIEITLMDQRTFQAEFVGIDQFTKLAFCRITTEEPTEFEYLKLQKKDNYKIGEVLTAYILLPKYVVPPLAADIGLVSAIIQEPEEFVLTVGFNELEVGSVLYDSAGTAVGVLGRMNNPGAAEFGTVSSSEAYGRIEDYLPLLGVVDVNKVEKLVAEPPVRGEITRGWLGIHLQALTADMADFWNLNVGGGIIVNDVVDNSPAERAGLKTGDIIVKLNGRPIEVNQEETLPVFQRQIAELAAGTQVDFEVFRRENGRIDTLDIVATLDRAPLSPTEAPDYEDTDFEMKLRDMVFADYNIYNLDQKKFEGVVVKEVESGGWASVGGIDPGDIIQSIGGTKVTNVDEARRVLESLAEAKPEEVVFFIWRDNKTLFINIKTDW